MACKPGEEKDQGRDVPLLFLFCLRCCINAAAASHDGTQEAQTYFKASPHSRVATPCSPFQLFVSLSGEVKRQAHCDGLGVHLNNKEKDQNLVVARASRSPPCFPSSSDDALGLESGDSGSSVKGLAYFSASPATHISERTCFNKEKKVLHKSDEAAPSRSSLSI